MSDDVDPRAETEALERVRKDERVSETQVGHGSGGYRQDQLNLARTILRGIAGVATAGLIAVLTWLVVQAFVTQGGMALLNLKVDLMMEKLHVEQPKAAK